MTIYIVFSPQGQMKFASADETLANEARDKFCIDCQKHPDWWIVKPIEIGGIIRTEDQCSISTIPT